MAIRMPELIGISDPHLFDLFRWKQMIEMIQHQGISDKDAV